MTDEQLKELLHDFTVWIEIGGLVEENPNRTEQDWLDQIGGFIEERNAKPETIQPPQDKPQINGLPIKPQNRADNTKVANKSSQPSPLLSICLSRSPQPNGDNNLWTLLTQTTKTST